MQLKRCFNMVIIYVSAGPSQRSVGEGGFGLLVGEGGGLFSAGRSS